MNLLDCGPVAPKQYQTLHFGALQSLQNDGKVLKLLSACEKLELCTSDECVRRNPLCVHQPHGPFFVPRCQEVATERIRGELTHKHRNGGLR